MEKITELGDNLEEQRQKDTKKFLDACSSGRTGIVESFLSRMDWDRNVTNCYGQTGLHLACLRRKTTVIQRLLADWRTDILRADVDGNQPWHLVAIEGDEDTLEALLLRYRLDNERKQWCAAKNKDYNDPGQEQEWFDAMIDGDDDGLHGILVDPGPLFRRNRQGYTPLHLMFQAKQQCYRHYNFEDAERYGRLITQWENILKTVQGFDGNHPATPLHYAVRQGKLATITALLDESPGMWHAFDAYGYTAFDLSAMMGSSVIVRHLMPKFVSEGVSSLDPHQRNLYGETALHLAVRYGKIDWVQAMLEIKSINPNPCDKKGMTPWHEACLQPNQEMVAIFLADPRVDTTAKNQEKQHGLHLACMNGHAEVVTLILKAADVARREERLFLGISEEDSALCTPLDLACQNGHTRIVQSFLLRDDVDPNKNSPGMRGFTSLARACEYHKNEVVACLLKNSQLNPNRGSPQGVITPLGIACEQDNHEAFKFLLGAKNVDPNLADCNGATPLSIATRHGHLAMVRRLMKDPRVDIRIADHAGQTPLAIACEYGHEEVVAFMAQDIRLTGADVFHRNRNNTTPLDLSIRKGNLLILRFLMLCVQRNLGPRDRKSLSKALSLAIAIEASASVTAILESALNHLPSGTQHRLPAPVPSETRLGSEHLSDRLRYPVFP